MAAVEPLSTPPDDGDDDDDDSFVEEESSDEDSVPEEPEFEMELPWYRNMEGHEDDRVLYTRARCVVKVRTTDTIGDLRRKVAQEARLEHFKLSIDGVELLAEEPEDERKKRRNQGDSDEDGDDEDDDDEDDDESNEDEEDEEQKRQMAIMMAVGSEKERLEAEEAERQRLKHQKETLPRYDKRTLAMVGVKEPPRPKTKEEMKADLVRRAMAADAARDAARDAAENEEDTGVDASFLPPREGQPDGEAKDGEESPPTPNAAGGGGTGDDDALLLSEEDRPSAVIVIDEFDELLDDRINKKPESSQVLLQRAINAANLTWWERAADGNMVTAKQCFNESKRKDLLQVNWRNPDLHERSAVMECSFRGQHHALRWLVDEMGARVNGSDMFGCTALNLAARGGYPKIVRFLLEHRAKTEASDRNGWTAAVWALAMGHLDVLQVMADMGVPLADLGRAAPFDSAHMSPTTLLPLPCVRYKADQTQARQRSHRHEMALRAKAHAEKQEQLRAAKEAELMGMQEKLKQTKVEQYKHRYMRDARENWSKRPLDKQKPPKRSNKSAADGGGSLA